jgi:HEAT repeat protein
MDAKTPRVSIRRVLVAAGVLAAVGLGARVVHTRVSAAPGGAASAGANSGRQRRWSVALETHIRQAGPGHDKDTVITLTGDWVATVSAESPAGTDVAYELHDAHAAGSGFGDVGSDDVAKLERNLGQRFWVTYQPDGAATRVHFPREMPDDVRNFLELVATQSQFVRPLVATPQWTATERDAAGAYFATYDTEAPGHLLKRKLRYLAVDGASTGRDSAIGVRVDESEMHFSLDTQGRVDSCVGREATYVDAKLGALGLDIEIALRMDHPRDGRDATLAGSLERAEAGLESGPIVTQRASDAEMVARRDARLVRGLTLAQALDVVRAGHPDDASRSRLEALLRVRPDDIPPALVFARGADRQAAVVLLQALGAAGTPAAQQALCAVAQDEGVPLAIRTESVGALVRTRRPTPATIDALLDLTGAKAPELRQLALYMTGTAGAHSVQSDPPAAARIEGELLRRFESCHAEGCVDVLAALGNLGTPGIVPSVERALGAADAAERAAAVRALRGVGAPDADRLISKTMTEDTQPSVRAAAVFAATFRSLQALFPALARAIEQDPSEDVRSAAIEAVAGHVDESAQVDRALAAAASKDRSAGIRRLASRTLGAGPDAGP